MSARPTASIDVVPVRDRRGLDAFIDVPRAIYRDDPAWVAPLRIERRQAYSPSHPFFQHARWQAWVAWRDGQPVGRISAQVDALHLERYRDRTGFFGCIEAPDDPVVFRVLFASAERWLRQQGMSRVRGPFHLNVNQESGLLVDGFDTPPYVMMGHARRWYGPRIEALGYAPAQELLAYDLPLPFTPAGALEKLCDRLKTKIRLRPFNPRRRAAELETLREIFNDAWSENWSFVPYTQAEFRAMGRELLLLIPPEFIQIAEADGAPAAFMLVVPNVNEAIADLDGRLLPFGWAKLLWRLKLRHTRSVRTALMGVRRRYQRSLMRPALAYAAIRACQEAALAYGANRSELSWILADNHGMRGIIERIGGTVSKRYRMYDKNLSDET